MLVDSRIRTHGLKHTINQSIKLKYEFCKVITNLTKQTHQTIIDHKLY